MATLSAQITDLVGGTIDQPACDQWAVDGVKEIILQLPAAMQEQASDKTTVTSDSALSFNTATVGKVLYCTRHNGSYDIPCRLVTGVNAGLVDDSTASNYYATADDPAYFLRDNKAEIKPNPDGNGGSFYHIVYPSSINVDVDSTIANFPNEADHLVVLYAAIRQLLQYQSTMSTIFNTDITGAFTQARQGLVNMATEIAFANQEVDDALTEIGEAIGLVDNSSNIQVALDAMNTTTDRFRESTGDADPASFGKETEYTTSTGMTKVKDALDNAQNLIDNNAPASGYDVYDHLQNEDTEMVQATLSTAQAEIQRAQVHIQEWQTVHGTLVSEINAFASEASARFGWINAKAVVWQGELSTAQGYMATAGGYLNQTNGFIAEANARLGADNAKYAWYGDQFAKLQAQYVAGITALKGT